MRCYVIIGRDLHAARRPSINPRQCCRTAPRPGSGHLSWMKIDPSDDVSERKEKKEKKAFQLKSHTNNVFYRRWNMKSVADRMLNRLFDGYFGMTIYKNKTRVIHQKPTQMPSRFTLTIAWLALYIAG